MDVRARRVADGTSEFIDDGDPQARLACQAVVEGVTVDVRPHGLAGGHQVLDCANGRQGD